jgi:hypothetical protein
MAMFLTTKDAARQLRIHFRAKAPEMDRLKPFILDLKLPMSLKSDY